MGALDQYKERAVWLMRRLIPDFCLADFQAAGPCGNGYQESMLRAEWEEDGIVTSPTRGIGWFQWTGPRHRSFMAFCAGRLIDWRSNEAEYGYLKHELQTDYAHVIVALKDARTLAEATGAFERYYEMAGIVQMEHRLTGAEIALHAYRDAKPDAMSLGAPTPTAAKPRVPTLTALLRDIESMLGRF